MMIVIRNKLLYEIIILISNTCDSSMYTILDYTYRISYYKVKKDKMQIKGENNPFARLFIGVTHWSM
jgi:hypothetical protein